jgi:hypothetical protein
MTLQERISRQISQLRGTEHHKHDCVCVCCTRDWYSDESWPILFRELPKGSRLYQPQENSEPCAWKLCACMADGQFRGCHPGDSPGEVVSKAWLAFALAKDLLPDIEKIRAILASPSSGSVN